MSNGDREPDSESTDLGGVRVDGRFRRREDQEERKDRLDEDPDLRRDPAAESRRAELGFFHTASATMPSA